MTTPERETGTRPVGTLEESRLYDLVRFCRHDLHTAKLITNEEYAWLAMAATEGKPNQGSLSAQRLATYDELRAEVARLTEALRSLRDDMRERVLTYDDAARDCENALGRQSYLARAEECERVGRTIDDVLEEVGYVE